MKTSILPLAILSCLLGIMACSTQPDLEDIAPVTVEVTSVDPVLGRVSGTVHNTSGVTLWFGDCMTGVESQQDGTWKSVDTLRVCAGYLGKLPRGHSVDFVAELPDPSAPCPLRISASLQVSSPPTPTESITGKSDTFCPET
jgi:hypothetical protein